MRVLVTGGAGFIGSHLVDRLLDDGREVVVLDNFSSGRPSNLAHIAGNSRLQVHEVDVTDQRRIMPYFEGVDQVYHIAGIGDIVPSIENPRPYYDSNVSGTVSVLEATRQNGVRRLVYAASSTCYGMPDVFPTPESAPIRPQFPYALTKYLGEQCVMHWGHVYQLPVVSLRLFNVFGPRSRTSGSYGAVFGVFLAQKLAGKPLTVVGDGTQTRDFTYVSDVANAFVTAADSSLTDMILNVGSGGTCSVNRLADILGGPRISIPKRPGEPDCTFADIHRIQEILGWKPQVSFEEGVRRVLACIDDWRDAPVWTVEKIEVATRAWFAHLSKPG
ncbi:MAG: SDR family oxidoreductase [Candidatus Xenobia bacterium]